ncbi:MAG: hypothetical protein ABI954_06795 [Pyrinomonadaceae bacterium]
MNRKLIRPNLADVKSQERDSQNNRDLRGDLVLNRTSVVANKINMHKDTDDSVESAASSASKNRRPPQVETNAEIFYYKKQIDSHTLMIIVLQDGEEIEGTIEWYDRNALKINRKNAANILLLKHNIKYMFKAEDRIS